MKPVNMLERARREGGFTMIEVLIAMVYLTIGLLGIIAMEDVALSRNVDAKRITIATNLATEMIDRVRMNSPANITPPPAILVPGDPYLYNGIVACAAALGNCAGETFPANPGNTPQATLGPAWGDYVQWTDHFRATDANGVPLLPNGVGTVTSTVIGDPSLGQVQIDVTVKWTTGFRNPAVTMTTIVAPL